MRLKKLIQHIKVEVKGSKEVEITGICAHSQRVAPGNLFVAKRGAVYDGNQFIPEAIRSGAIAILTDLFDPFISVTQLICPNIAEVEALLVAEFFQHPSSQLKMIGITGTNGKTTSSFLIKYLLDHSDLLAGLIGSIECIVGKHHLVTESASTHKFTTTDVITTHKLLREMVNVGCQSAVLEVTSHALVQNRVGAIDFDIALFTNLSQDHLDYHKTMEDYQKAKQQLFLELKEGKWAVLNADEAFSVETKATILTYGIENQADLKAKDVLLSDKGVQFTACYQQQEVLCKSPLIGLFNVYNLLGAMAVGLCLQISLEKSSQILKNFKSVPGRLERIKNKLGLHIFVDFAHTEQALYNVLKALQPIKEGKLITVFGCGGDRDKDKRKKMGAVVCELSDETIITNDNPRTENGLEIAEQILQGFSEDHPVTVELDRKKAIERAIEKGKSKDIILIAGKGHEKHQIFAQQMIPFDDAQIAYEICLQKERL